MRKAGASSLIAELGCMRKAGAGSLIADSKSKFSQNVNAASIIPGLTFNPKEALGDPRTHVIDNLSSGLGPHTPRMASKGSRPVLTTSVACALFLGTRLDLIWTVQSLGFAPSHIHLRDASLENTISVLLPNATICRTTSPSWQQSLPPVVFVQGHAHSFPFLFDTVNFVFATKARSQSFGRGPPGWSMLHTWASHASVGGVTNTTNRCYLWSRVRGVPTVRLVKVPHAVARDVHSVVSDVVSGTPSQGPANSCLITPEVTALHPGLYHAGRLLPCDTLRPLFQVRSVFLPTRWCDRRLTLSERAAVYDVPHHIVAALPSASLARTLVHPGRTLERCIHELHAHAGILDRGGLLFFGGGSGPAAPRVFPVASKLAEE
jgi:hypothetical protein